MFVFFLLLRHSRWHILFPVFICFFFMNTHWIILCSFLCACRNTFGFFDVCVLFVLVLQRLHCLFKACVIVIIVYCIILFIGIKELTAISSSYV